MSTTNPDLAKPEGLSTKGSAAYDLIMSYLTKHKLTYTGGGKAFYSPQEWAERGELYARGSILVVVYDGGDQGEAFSLDKGYPTYTHVNTMTELLMANDMHYEEGTTWYGGVYDDAKAAQDEQYKQLSKTAASTWDGVLKGTP
tara:strand:+ start:1767 stop:2195 length:429 start_codon:yes stop_codon:yes gene_type:complete